MWRNVYEDSSNHFSPFERFKTLLTPLCYFFTRGRVFTTTSESVMSMGRSHYAKSSTIRFVGHFVALPPRNDQRALCGRRNAQRQRENVHRFVESPAALSQRVKK